MNRSILFLFLIIIGCTSAPSLEGNSNTYKVKEILSKSVSSNNELSELVNELIIDSKFDIEQKSQLHSLHSDLDHKLEVNSLINIKLRALLYKELFSTYYNSKEIEVIATMLEKNNFERNSLILDTIRVANLITDRNDSESEPEKLGSDSYFDLLY